MMYTHVKYAGVCYVLCIYIYIYRYEYMRIDRRKRLQVLSVSDASSGMLDVRRYKCIAIDSKA